LCRWIELRHAVVHRWVGVAFRKPDGLMTRGLAMQSSRKLLLPLGVLLLALFVSWLVSGDESGHAMSPSVTLKPTDQVGQKEQFEPLSVESSMPRSVGVAERRWRTQGRSLVSPDRQSFTYELRELSDAGSPNEMEWLLRNGIPPASFSGRGGEFSDTIDSINPDDGIDIYEIDRLKSFALSRNSEVRRRALAMLHQSAMLGSIGALDAISNAYAWGPDSNAMLAEAYALVAWSRGDWLSSSARPVGSMGAEDRATSTLQASRILEALNQSRMQMGLPPLQADRRPGSPLPAGPGKP